MYEAELKVYLRGPLLLLSLLAYLVQGWVFASEIEDIHKSASSILSLPACQIQGWLFVS